MHITDQVAEGAGEGGEEGRPVGGVGESRRVGGAAEQRQQGREKGRGRGGVRGRGHAAGQRDHLATRTLQVARADWGETAFAKSKRARQTDRKRGRGEVAQVGSCAQ